MAEEGQDMLAASFSRLLSRKGRDLGAMAFGSPLCAASVARFYKGRNGTSKPPNVLVFSTKKDQRLTSAVLALEANIPSDSYLVYPLSEDSIKGPWQDSAALLVLLNAASGRTASAIDAYNGPVVRWIQEDLTGLAEAAWEALGADEGEVAEVPELTEAFLHCKDAKVKEDIATRGIVKGDTFTLAFVDKLNCRAEEDFLPVLINADDGISTFNGEKFFDRLHTTDFGRVLLHAPVIGSTFQPFEANTRGLAMLERSLCVIADRQTSGRGRGGNKWISPKGALAFSLQFSIQQRSPLGKHAPFLCHLAALSVVAALKSLSEESDLRVAIKWPNDIYLNRREKVGGLLLNSRMFGDDLIVSLGIGLNLDNAKPTVSVNSVLKEEDKVI